MDKYQSQLESVREILIRIASEGLFGTIKDQEEFDDLTDSIPLYCPYCANMLEETPKGLSGVSYCINCGKKYQVKEINS